jgi:hypothetical protein
MPQRILKKKNITSPRMSFEDGVYCHDYTTDYKEIMQKKHSDLLLKQLDKAFDDLFSDCCSEESFDSLTTHSHSNPQPIMSLNYYDHQKRSPRHSYGSVSKLQIIVEHCSTPTQVTPKTADTRQSLPAQHTKNNFWIR